MRELVIAQIKGWKEGLRASGVKESYFPLTLGTPRSAIESLADLVGSETEELGEQLLTLR